MHAWHCKTTATDIHPFAVPNWNLQSLKYFCLDIFHLRENYVKSVPDIYEVIAVKYHISLSSQCSHCVLYIPLYIYIPKSHYNNNGNGNSEK